MAQTFLNTATQAGNFEDLVNYIYKISYDQTPFANAIGSVKAKSIAHDWMTQALRGAAANAQTEGFAPTMAAASQTVRVRRTNQVQILADDYSSSMTQDYIEKAGLGSGEGSEYDNQADLREMEVMKDLDRALLVSTIVTRDGDAPTAGQMDGALAWAPAGNRIDAGGAAITQDLYEGLTRTLWELTGQTTDLIVCGGFVRRGISTWTTQFKQHDMKDTKMTDTVETYRGDWGTQVVLPDPHITASSLLVTRKETIKKAYLRPIAHYELGRLGDRREGYVVMECTLEVRNPNLVGRITNLQSS